MDERTLLLVYNGTDDGSIPKWWENFINIHCNNISMDKWPAIRDRALEEYNTCLINNLGEYFLEFKNGNDATYFKLKWSY